MGSQSVIGELPSFDFSVTPEQAPFWTAIGAAERICAAAFLIALLPVLTFVALLIVVLSKRSPLIAHCRVGQNGRPFWVLKLRSMWDLHPQRVSLSPIIEYLPTDSVCPVQPKGQKDPRVTSRFATFCRRYSIDELPQLWHVLKGEMALLGPRPLTAAEIETHYGAAAVELLQAKPGLTGLWQTAGRSRLTYSQRRRLDLFMVRNWSVRLYLTILLRTLPTVLTGKDAW